MTIYSFHRSELLPGSPRVLPLPLVPSSIYLTPVGDFPDDVEEFLGENSVSLNDPRGMWLCRIWDLTVRDDLIAMAAYSWRNDCVVRDALHMDDVHHALDLPGYLDMMGYGLFGQSYGSPSFVSE